MRFPGDFWTARLDSLIMTQFSQFGVRCENVTESDDDDGGAISSLAPNGPRISHLWTAISIMIVIMLRGIWNAKSVAGAFRCAEWVFAERFVENTVVDMGSDGPLWSVPAGGGLGGCVAGRRCS